MKAKLIKIQERPSRFGGVFYYLFFKNTEGASFKTCVAPYYGNYRRWRPVIDMFYKEQRELWLDGLIVKGKTGRLIDADSDFKIIPDGISQSQEPQAVSTL